MKMQTINRKDHIPQLIVIYPSDAKMVPNSQTNQCDMLHPKRSMKHLFITTFITTSIYYKNSHQNWLEGTYLNTIKTICDKCTIDILLKRFGSWE